MQDRLTNQDDDRYRGLHLSDEERDWVKHYLRVADQVLFERRPAPRVVVVEDEWGGPPQRPRITPKDKAA